VQAFARKQKGQLLQTPLQDFFDKLHTAINPGMACKEMKEIANLK
jgi:hypothetical protein